MDADPATVAKDDGADLQKLQADGAGLGASHLGALQGQPPDRLDQRIGEA